MPEYIEILDKNGRIIYGIKQGKIIPYTPKQSLVEEFFRELEEEDKFFEKLFEEDDGE
jgi:hypothetical protein